MSLEDYNYYHDQRVANMHLATTADALMEYLIDSKVLPEDYHPTYVWEVCPTCGGEGHHVNPSVDCGGLTAEDFAQDPDFAQDYIDGVYDVPCYTCGGRTTVKVLDITSFPPEVKEIADSWLREEAMYQAIQRAELAMGA